MKTVVSSLRAYFGAFAVLFILTDTAPADTVVASDRAADGVHVRQRPQGNSRSVGVLAPDEQAELLSSVARWHRIKLPNGTVGYVSKSWTEVWDSTPVATPPASSQPVAPPAATAAAGNFTIHAVDVGTGLGVVVRGPDFVVVFDAGSNDDVAQGDKNRVLTYMHKVLPDVRQINHLILSHPHKDHAQLLSDVVRAYDVRHVWDSGAVNNTCVYRAFIAAVAEKAGTIYRSAKNGEGTFSVRFTKKCPGIPGPKTIQLRHGPKITNEPITLGADARMTILHADGSNYGNAFNKNSLVVRFDLGGKRVLMMGDAEAGGRDLPTKAPKPNSIEGKLLTCCASELQADVLVVGHHGSKTSSRTAFLNAVNARIFIVSSGPKKYQSVTLPDKEVRLELERRGTLLRTDLDDRACKRNPAKIGPDRDNKPGGCDNIQISIKNGAPQIGADYWRGAD